tara:strand:- start:6580 stop:6945 length:366 start_codon:yes stop_codon:yes gene_type:complete
MKHFNLSEFDSPDLIGSGERMSKEFLRMLDDARDLAGITFKINSGYRTEAKNNAIYKSLGKTPIKSSHLQGFAADIHCNNSQDRLRILNALIQNGFKRIGIAKTFIHCDNDPLKVNAVWIY